MMVLDPTPELPLLLLSGPGEGGAGVALGVSVAVTTTSLVMTTTTPFSPVLDILVWLVDGRMMRGIEVGVVVVGGLVVVGLAG